MKQKQLEPLVNQYILSLENSNLSDQIKKYNELEEFVKNTTVNLGSELMVNLARDKPSLHKRILELQSEKINSSASTSFKPG